MQITATISVINPVVTGVSRSNGHEWRSQEVVLSWNKDLGEGRVREQHLQVTLHGEGIDRLAGLNPVAGQTVIEGELDFDTRSYNGRVYNEITLFL